MGLHGTVETPSSASLWPGAAPRGTAPGSAHPTTAQGVCQTPAVGFILLRYLH